MASKEAARGKAAGSTLLTVPTEILEMMLTSLPFPALVACQKVCRRFKDTISQSKSLQNALTCELTTTRTVQPVYGAFQAAQISETSRKLCPLLSQRVERPQSIGLLEDCPVFNLAATQYLAESETWASIYLNSPPVNEALFHLAFEFISGTNHVKVARTARVRSPDGGHLTLGQMYDMTMDDKQDPRLHVNPLRVEVRTEVKWPELKGEIKRALKGGPSHDQAWPSLGEQVKGLESVLGRKAEVGEDWWVQFPVQVAREI